MLCPWYDHPDHHESIGGLCGRVLVSLPNVELIKQYLMYGCLF